MTVILKTAPPTFPTTDFERLKEQTSQGIEAEKTRLLKATREFESFFMYYMLKSMRKTVPKNPFDDQAALGRSMGKELFTDMFDIEVARRISRGEDRSISRMLYKSLEKLIDAKSRSPDPQPSVIPVVRPDPEGIQVKPETKPLQNKANRFIQRPRPAFSLPVSRSSRVEQEDPIIARYGSYIDQAARETKLDSALIVSVIKAESNGDPNAVSRRGAKGLMQLTDTTAREMGVRNPFDPQANIRGGSRYLRKMLDKYDDLSLALAAYNAGPGNVDKYGGIPPFRETRVYVTRVSSFLREAVARLGHSDAKVRRDASR